MSRLANANVQSKVIRALQRAGFEKHEGSNHTIMHHPDGRMTTIPRHRRINPLTLKSILKQCALTEADYLKLY
jgi:predicted RNA binding protein YcfA (HicA-like mRNA interferase family)